MSSSGGLIPNQEKKIILTKHPPTSYYTDDSRDFLGVIKYPAKEKSPPALRNAFENFHAKSLRQQISETYTLKDLENMDQTPLPFVMDNNTTYD